MTRKFTPVFIGDEHHSLPLGRCDFVKVSQDVFGFMVREFQRLPVGGYMAAATMEEVPQIPTWFFNLTIAHFKGDSHPVKAVLIPWEKEDDAKHLPGFVFDVSWFAS